MVIPELKQIEQKIIARRYREHLTHAMAAACNQLTADERLLLLLRYEADLTLREIAKSLGTHAPGSAGGCARSSASCVTLSFMAFPPKLI